LAGGSIHFFLKLVGKILEKFDSIHPETIDWVKDIVDETTGYRKVSGPGYCPLHSYRNFGLRWHRFYGRKINTKEEEQVSFWGAIITRGGRSVEVSEFLRKE